MVSRFAQGHGWNGVPKNVHMGRWNMVSATEGTNHTSGVTKEPYYRYTEGTGGKNWPKRKKVPRTLILRRIRAEGGGGEGVQGGAPPPCRNEN